LLLQLSAVAEADCDGPAAWQLLSPGLAGEGTLSLVAPRNDAAPRAALSVARHALSNTNPTPNSTPYPLPPTPYPLPPTPYPLPPNPNPTP
jgi:hypothetical protein